MQNNKEVKPAATKAAPVNPVNAAIENLSSVISEWDHDYATDVKGFYKQRDGNERAKALRDALNGLVFRLHKFISA